MISMFKWLLRRLPCKEIGDGKGSAFFRRYKLLDTRWGSAYLHEFLRSDHDRCLHDHPWPFVAIILRGGYWEYTGIAFPGDGTYYRNDRGNILTAVSWRRPGSILVRPATFAHRIEIEPGSRPWSLVLVGRKARDWGFHGPGGWVAWRPDYSPACPGNDLQKD